MKKVNKYIQYALLATIAIRLIVCLVEPGFSFWLVFFERAYRNPHYLGSLLGVVMVWGLPLGLSQYIGSALDIVFYGNRSKHIWHLLLSTLTIAILFDLFPVDGLDAYAWYSSGPLAVYYWILVFRKDKKSINKKSQ